MRVFNFIRNKIRRIQGNSGVGFLPDFNADSIVNSIIYRRVEPISFADLYITDKNGRDTDILAKAFLQKNFFQIYQRMIAQTMRTGYAICLIDKRNDVFFGISMPNNIEIFMENDVVIKAKYNGIEYGSNEIVVLYDTFYQTFGISRYDSCVNDLKILGAIQSARYTTARYRGALGILSKNSTGNPTPTAHMEDERKMIEEKYKQNYGITDGQAQIIITNQDLKWQSMAQPISTLGLKESKRECIDSICMVFGIKPELFLGGSTYSNTEGAELSLLVNVIIPNANADMQVFKKQLGFKGMIKLDFSENPILKKHNANSDKNTIEILNTMYNNNAISVEEYRANMQKFIDL